MKPTTVLLAAALSVAFAASAAPNLEKALKALPGATNYVFHLKRDAFADSLGLDFNSLDPSGYYLARRGRDVVIAGRTAKGSSYALADFLKRYAGYRNFGTKFGLIPPHTDNLVLPDDFTFREEPDVPSVNVAGGGGMGSFGRDGHLTCRATHAMSQMVKKEMFETHPEYFPMIKGERRNPKAGPWNPCMSNPDLPKLFDAYADESFRKNPDMLGLAMGVNDGGGDCQCPQCEAMWRKHGNQYVNFYNMAAKRLAKSHPGKYLAFIAYSVRCRNVPTGVTMEPNILVEVTGMVPDMFAALRGWKEIGVKNFGVYEYLYAYNGSRIAPGYYPHDIADYFRRLYKEFGMKTLWEEYFAWTPIIDAGRQYVVNELMWNMDANVDALLDDYFKSLYGPAEKQMRRFHEIAEAAYARRKAKPDWGRYFVDYHNPRQFEGYSFEDLSAMDAALAEAAAAAKGNKDVSRRVTLVGRVWEFQKSMIENWICVQKIKLLDDPDEIAAFARRGLAAIGRAEWFELTPDEERWVCCGKRGGAMFKRVLSGRMAPKPILEQAVDDACFRATAKLGKAKVRTVWNRLGADPVFAPYAGTQLFLMDNRPANLLRNVSFEDLTPAPAKPEKADADWKPLNLAGRCWAQWTFPNTRAVVFVDSTEAHSGTNSVCIKYNQHGASILAGLSATPRTRYRASAWVKTRNAGGREANLGGFSVRMKDKNGKWIDGGSAIGAKVPPEALDGWVKISCTFTTPDLADDRLGVQPIFGAPGGQADDDRIWWDDVSLEKLWEAPPKMPPQVEFARDTAKKWIAGWKGVELPELVWDKSMANDVWRAEKLGGAVRIVGGAEGLRLGVYAWCKALGIRWFSPNEKPVIPSRPKTLADSFFGERRPSFKYRGLHVCGCPDHYDPNVAHWMSFNGFNRRLDDLREALVHREDYARFGLVSDTTVHSYALILPADHYYDDHPDYYALIGGKRSRRGGQLCLANKKMRKAFVESLKEWLAKLPDVSPVGVCPNDGYGWCECKACRALDTDEDRKNGTVNGRVADFVKFLAGEFKDRTIGNYSYSNFADFFKLIDPLPENLVLSYTAFHCQAHPLFDASCPKNATFARRLDELTAKRARFYIYDYYTYKWGFLPAPMWKVVARDFKAWHKLGVEGFLSEVSATGATSWDSFWPSLLMAGEMMLDADADPDALLDDWCAARYGRAAKAMRAYFRAWEKGVDGSKCFLKKPYELAGIFRADAEMPLAAAERADGGNEFVKRARRQYDSWKANIAERVKYVTPAEVAVGSELRKLPLHFVNVSSQVVDKDNDTDVEMAVADGKVRVRLTMHESNMAGLKTVESVYTSDSVELFFADGKNDKKTYHFLVDHNARISAADSEGKRWNWNWPHHATAKTEKRSDRWVLDFEMPLSDAHVADMSELRFTFARNRYAGGRWQTTGTPAGGAFFAVDDYVRAKAEK